MKVQLMKLGKLENKLIEANVNKDGWGENGGRERGRENSLGVIL